MNLFTFIRYLLLFNLSTYSYKNKRNFPIQYFVWLQLQKKKQTMISMRLRFTKPYIQQFSFNKLLGLWKQIHKHKWHHIKNGKLLFKSTLIITKRFTRDLFHTLLHNMKSTQTKLKYRYFTNNSIVLINIPCLYRWNELRILYLYIFKFQNYLNCISKLNCFLEIP